MYDYLVPCLDNREYIVVGFNEYRQEHVDTEVRGLDIYRYQARVRMSTVPEVKREQGLEVNRHKALDMKYSEVGKICSYTH